MANIIAIVEGDGEVEAVPVLIRRIGAARRRSPSFDKMWRAVTVLLQSHH